MQYSKRHFPRPGYGSFRVVVATCQGGVVKSENILTLIAAQLRFCSYRSPRYALLYQDNLTFMTLARHFRAPHYLSTRTANN